jgi:hypothetical protein
MMNSVKMNRGILIFFLAAFLTIGLTTSAWAHGEGTTIVPVSLTAKAGSELQVKVSGLVGTKTATFRLTGMFGKFELGEFPISSDDFTQVLKIPADAQPGSYRLTVEGGEKSAKVVITVN